ncbi:MAG: trigger factor [bacterium]
MKVIVEQVGPCRKALRIEVPAEQVATEYQAVIKEIASNARVPGFRKGKAPAAVIEKQFSKDALEETRERLVPKAYHEALRQEQVKAVSIVDVSDIQITKQLPLSFKVTVDLLPEFTLPAYKEIALTSKKVEVKDEDVDEILTNMRNRSAHFEPVSGRASQKDDVVEIDYTGACDGKPMSEIAPDRPELAQGKDFWVLLSDTMPEFLPGIKAQIEGMDIGQTREVTVTFPADYRAKSAAGKSAVYTITVKGIRERKSPELNDDFAKTMGADTVGELRKLVSENLMRTGEATEKGRQKDDLVKWLVENTALTNLPQSLVEEEARHIIQDVVQENVKRGVNKDEIESHREDIFTRAAQSASERVTVNYILNRIADEEKVAVTQADVEQRIAEMAQRYGSTPEKMKEELAKRGSLDQLRGSLRLDKTVDLLHASAKITPEK